MVHVEDISDEKCDRQHKENDDCFDDEEIIVFFHKQTLMCGVFIEKYINSFIQDGYHSDLPLGVVS